MFLQSWYTDLMNIYRVVESVDNGLTTHKRVEIAKGVPCRVYSSQINNYNVRETAATVTTNEKLACSVDVDIMAGDELFVTRGGNLKGRLFTRTPQTVRYIAGSPQAFYDPLGGALTGLEHLEVGLLRDNVAR